MKEKNLKKNKMIKPYYVHKGKRYGIANEIKTPFGITLPFLTWKALTELGIMSVLGFYICFIYNISKPVFLEIIENCVSFCFSVHIVYFFVKACRCMSCFYCAETKEEVEQYIEERKKQGMHFKNTLKDIVYEGGWYMLYSKNQKEIMKDMLQRPNVYIRKCPKKLKKHFNGTLEVLSFILSLALVISIFIVCEEFLALNDLLLYVIAFLPFFIYVWYDRYQINIFNKCITQFCEEENFPKEEYLVRVKYDKDEGGQLAFLVTPKKTETNESIKVYTKIIPLEKKKLFSENLFFILLMLPFIVLISLSFWASSGLVSILIVAIICIVLFLPVYVLVFKKDKFIQECKRQLCNEKNISLEEHQVRVKYSKDERLIFTVAPKKNLEKEDNNK